MCRRLESVLTSKATPTERANVCNRLLQTLPSDDFALIAGDLELVDLPRREVIEHPSSPIEFAYFLQSGLGSAVAISPDGRQIEAGMFGVEGMSGLPVLLGADRGIIEVVMQVPGQGFRLAAARLQAVLDVSSTLRAILLRYAHTFTTQSAYTALSNGIHTVEERLARWLLISHDRVGTAEIALARDYLAIMLGVRRATVTTSLHSLQSGGLVTSRRGSVMILDSRGLEELASDAYGKAEAEYARLFGPLRLTETQGTIDTAGRALGRP